MNKMETTKKETYETPAIQDIAPVTTGVVPGNRDPGGSGDGDPHDS